jgi:hypothetical protein
MRHRDRAAGDRSILGAGREAEVSRDRDVRAAVERRAGRVRARDHDHGRRERRARPASGLDPLAVRQVCSTGTTAGVELHAYTV